MPFVLSRWGVVAEGVYRPVELCQPSARDANELSRCPPTPAQGRAARHHNQSHKCLDAAHTINERFSRTPPMRAKGPRDYLRRVNLSGRKGALALRREMGIDLTPDAASGITADREPLRPAVDLLPAGVSPRIGGNGPSQQTRTVATDVQDFYGARARARVADWSVSSRVHVPMTDLKNCAAALCCCRRRCRSASICA